MQNDYDPSERTMALPHRPAHGDRFGSALRMTGDLPRSPAEALEPLRAPAPPRRSRMPRERLGRAGSLFRFLNATMTFVLMISILSGALLYGLRTLFDLSGPLPHSTVLVIPKGESVNSIAARLERDGIVDDSRIFMAAVLWFRAKDKLKAGEYEIKKGASMRQVLNTLMEGRAILYKVTVPEGLTTWQIVEKLKEVPDLTGEVATLPPEGSLLPDTYKFSRGMSRQELLERMQGEHQKFLKVMWEKRSPGLPYKSPEEAMIMASIVERETGRADERDRVAAVFKNRLERRMRLQSDPTIIYGVVGGRGSLGRGILRSEIEQRTAYNTYQIDGLPPTPICNPGRSAIEATLNPAKTGDLYFVANGSGGHAFATNLADHNKNVAIWRQVEREIRAREAQAQAQAGAAAATPPSAQSASSAQPAAAVQPAPPGPAFPVPSGAPSMPPQSAPAPVQTLPMQAVPVPSQGQSLAPEQPALDVPLPVRKPKR